MVMRTLTTDFHQALSPSYVAEGVPSGEGFKVYLDRGRPRLQMAPSSSAPRARRCGEEKVLDQLTFGTSCNMTKPAEPSLLEKCRCACKARRRRSSTDGTQSLRLTRRMRRMLPLSKTFNIIRSATRKCYVSQP